MALHLLASLNSGTLANCLASIGKSDTLLLLGDAVYALQSVEIIAACQAATPCIYVLADDQHARLPHLNHTLPVINYIEWVNLTLTQTPVVSWY
jgi:sulfur relay protein TusB/DsrH